MTDVPLVTATTFRCDARDEVTTEGQSRKVLRLVGEFDGHAAAELETAIGHMQMPDEFEVDLAGVTFIDSMGLRVLVQWRRDADESGTAMTLARPAAPVQRLLDSTALAGFFAQPRTR